MVKRAFGDLPAAARVGVVVAGALELGLLVAAQVDITRRPADGIRGSKLVWRLVSLVNVFGPLAYFRSGRIRQVPRPDRTGGPEGP